MGGRPYHDSSAVFRMRIRIISKHPGIVRHADSKLAVNQSGIIHINCCWLRFDEYENLRNLLEIGQFRFSEPNNELSSGVITRENATHQIEGQVVSILWDFLSSWGAHVLFCNLEPHSAPRYWTSCREVSPTNKEKIALTDIPSFISL